MDLKMFNKDEFIRVAFGDRGIAIWTDRCAGAGLADLAIKYNTEYRKMNVELAKIKHHVSFFYTGQITPWVILRVTVVYCSYKAGVSVKHRQKIINTIFRRYVNIYDFINAPKRELLSLPGIGEVLLKPLLDIQKECKKAVHISESRKNTTT